MFICLSSHVVYGNACTCQATTNPSGNHPWTCVVPLLVAIIFLYTVSSCAAKLFPPGLVSCNSSVFYEGRKHYWSVPCVSWYLGPGPAPVQRLWKWRNKHIRTCSNCSWSDDKNRANWFIKLKNCVHHFPQRPARFASIWQIGRPAQTHRAQTRTHCIQKILRTSSKNGPWSTKSCGKSKWVCFAWNVWLPHTIWCIVLPPQSNCVFRQDKSWKLYLKHISWNISDLI